MKKTFVAACIFILSTATIFAQSEITAFNELIFPKFAKEKNITAPYVSFDGKYLIFVVINKDSFTFYECQDSSGKWNQPKEIKSINSALGKSRYKNSPVYNYDASKIYFEAQNGKNTDIFETSRTNTGWTKPKPLPSPINSKLDEAEPCISANDNNLFFVRFQNPKDKECGKIFLSKRKKNRQWSKPEALVSPINLTCERSPRILSDNKTLLFASIRGKDKRFKLYFTRNIHADFWLIPKALSQLKKHNYIFPSVDYKKHKLYLAEVSNSKKSKLDTATLPAEFMPLRTKILTGKITDKQGKPIKGTISLLNPISIEKQGVYSNNLDSGKYKIFIPPTSKYIIDITAPKYSSIFVDYNAKKSKNTVDTINASLFDTVRISLNIFDKDIYEPLDVKIKALNIQTKDTIYPWFKRLKKGKYKIKLPIGYNYNLILTSEYTKPYNLPIDLSGVVIFNSFEKNAEIISEKIAYTFKVLNKQTDNGVSCEIDLTNINTSKKIKLKAKTNANGEVTVYVRKGDMYDVTINPQGYAFYSTQFSVKNNKKKKIIVKLQELKKDTKIELNNITFETNSADLNVESYKELNKVIDLLEKNPKIKVEISAHTDDIGSESYNMKLSQKRAKSVVNYLISNDIQSDRLIAKGYGESQPLVPNTSDENRAKNRRVELKIIETNE